MLDRLAHLTYTRRRSVLWAAAVFVVVGTLLLLLGWRCFKQGSNARAALGLLLLLSGAALLALPVFL